MFFTKFTQNFSNSTSKPGRHLAWESRDLTCLKWKFLMNKMVEAQTLKSWSVRWLVIRENPTVNNWRSKVRCAFYLDDLHFGLSVCLVSRPISTKFVKNVKHMKKIHSLDFVPDQAFEEPFMKLFDSEWLLNILMKLNSSLPNTGQHEAQSTPLSSLQTLTKLELSDKMPCL